MVDIVTLMQCFQPLLTATTLRQFSTIVTAMLAMTGRVTMLGISRWAGAGGSYRSVQRFFYTVLPWATLFWLFFRQHVHQPDDVYLLAGDEVVVSKAGKQTHGLDRFFSSLYGKPVPGVAFFALSLVSTRDRHSFPIRVEQVVRERAAPPAGPPRRSRPTPSPAAPPPAPGTAQRDEEHGEDGSAAVGGVAADQRDGAGTSGDDRLCGAADISGA